MVPVVYLIDLWPLCLTLQSLGNHEFDDGVAGLAPYLGNITVPVVGANLDLTKEPSLANHLKPSTVLTVDGHKIGVIGYLTPETMVSISAVPANHSENYAIFCSLLLCLALTFIVVDIFLLLFVS